FTTVYLVQARPASWLQSKIDDTIELIPESTLYPKGRAVGEQTNRAEKDVSKLVATRAALECLGYDADFTGDGARVDAVPSGSPSSGRLRAGDVITEVAGNRIELPSQISDALSGRSPGQSVEVGFTRAGAPKTTTVTLGPSEDDARPPILGVAVSAKSPRVSGPVRVEVDSGTVSGPSAGLAWTLAIIDRMTPGSLTGGGNVAVTGEMLPDGAVGQIGGIAQKVAAVKRAGVRTFLYPAATPAAEQRRMREIAGTSVALRPVRTLDEAVRILDPQGVRCAE
ncbi:MAG: S16 family serine protease, partial [Actinomycetes bacterium]